MIKIITKIIATLGLMFAAHSAMALEGVKEIKLLANDGAITLIGEVKFSKKGDKTGYKITLNEAPFSDHFLSMRPFKCLAGSEKHWCYLPYPYDLKREITKEDLRDLEYDLLFIWKGATEYGINTWNGVYYDLEIAGDKILGTLNEMDMNIVSAPPDEPYTRLITDEDLTEGEVSGHWLPRLVIE